MNIVKICAVALLGTVVIFIVKPLKREFSSLITVAVSLTLLLAGVTLFYPTAKNLVENMTVNEFSPYISTVMKTLGIALLTEITSDLCADAGEASLGAKVELAGKAEILLICLPLINEILEMARNLING